MSRKKKRKLSIKKISKFLVCIIILFTIILNISNIRNFYLSKTTGYTSNTIEVFLENDIFKEIKDHEYSKTLETILNTEYYNEKYLKQYIKINYQKKETFLKNINVLLEKGYNETDINNIYDILSDESITLLLNENYIKDITNIILTEYFHENNLERYLKYYQEKELDTETTITHVNIGLDNDYYTNVIDIEDEESITVLVNKYNKLSKDFTPPNLQKVSHGSGQLQKEAAISFDEMCKAAKKENITIYGGSGYRSYSYQQNLYNRYVQRDGKQKADTYSARAGYSEHQTGLAMDILNSKWDYISETDKEHNWLINNSYKYGFILRYLKGKEEITGYKYEPWHYRYVGVELATEITGRGITYDEYIAKKS